MTTPEPNECGCVSPQEHGSNCFCAVTPLIHALGKSHALSILSYLGAHDRARFTAIQDRLDGLSSSTLATRLEELEEGGLITRVQFDEQNRVEYSLTKRGRALQQALRTLFPRRPAG